MNDLLSIVEDLVEIYNGTVLDYDSVSVTVEVDELDVDSFLKDCADYDISSESEVYHGEDVELILVRDF